MQEWKRYSYYEVFSGKFSESECNEIVELHGALDVVTSELFDSAGSQVRDSNLFWLRRSEKTSWIFQRVESAVHDYNGVYGFEIRDQVNIAQLTRYSAGQQYDWHMDLGANRSSLRKISVVVELTSKAAQVGGGIEVFYGDAFDNRVALDRGGLVIFPSFVMHRATKVQSGVRWSLVFWFEGETPLR